MATDNAALRRVPKIIAVHSALKELVAMPGPGFTTLQHCAAYLPGPCNLPGDDELCASALKDSKHLPVKLRGRGMTIHRIIWRLRLMLREIFPDLAYPHQWGTTAVSCICGNCPRRESAQTDLHAWGTNRSNDMFTLVWNRLKSSGTNELMIHAPPPSSNSKKLQAIVIIKLPLRSSKDQKTSIFQLIHTCTNGLSPATVQLWMLKFYLMTSTSSTRSQIECLNGPNSLRQSWRT